jgi:DNA-binding transcriptional MerR regulator
LSQKGGGKVEQEILQDVDRSLERVPVKTYYRIGEVARITGLKPYVLRYWETEFRPLAPPKSRSGQRTYRRSEIRAILLVKKLLYEQRFTIAGARRRLNALLRGGGGEAESEASFSSPPPGLLGELRRELDEIREILSGP